MFESPVIPPVHDAARLLATISELIGKARAEGFPVIYVQHCGGKGHPLEEGIPQWKIHPAIPPMVGEVVIKKHFCDSFYKTGLHDALQAKSVRKLIIAGIQSEFCVDTACRHAFSLGYEVTLVEDGHSTWDNRTLKAPEIISHHNETLGQMFATLAKAQTLFAPISSRMVARR
jgi:nicotinamidase-related amidase